MKDVSMNTVRVHRVVSRDEMAKRETCDVQLARRVIHKQCIVRDSTRGNVIAVFVKRAVNPSLLALVPQKCTDNANRGSAAGKYRHGDKLYPGDRVLPDGRIRARDGSVRTRPVKSNVIGYTRKDVLSAWTKRNRRRVVAMRPVIAAVMDTFKRTAPRAYARQAKHCTRKFMGFPLTSLALNENFRTALHTDRNDMAGSVSVMLVAGDDKVQGGELVLPEFDVAFDARAGDIVMFCPTLWHANAPFRNKEFKRVSLVAYAR